MNIAIIFAGGTGQRMRNSAKPKQFLDIYGKPIIIHTLEAFERHPEIDSIVIPCVAGWEPDLEEMLWKFSITKVKKILPGGKDTQESKMNALRYLKPLCKDDDIILLHDAVRPLISHEIITKNLESVRTYGSAVTVAPFNETCIISEDRKNTNKTIARNTLYIAKAPQSFHFKDVWEAHLQGQSMPYEITIDTCSLMTELGKTLHLVYGELTNLKVTTPEDYYLVKAILDMRENADIWGL